QKDCGHSCCHKMFASRVDSGIRSARLMPATQDKREWIFSLSDSFFRHPERSEGSRVVLRASGGCGAVRFCIGPRFMADQFLRRLIGSTLKFLEHRKAVENARRTARSFALLTMTDKNPLAAPRFRGIVAQRQRARAGALWKSQHSLFVRAWRRFLTAVRN